MALDRLSGEMVAIAEVSRLSASNGIRENQEEPSAFSLSMNTLQGVGGSRWRWR